MKVFSTKLLPESSKELFKANNIEFTEWTEHRKIDQAQLIDIVKEYDGVMVSGAQFDKNTLEAIKGKVKVLSLISVGYDNVDIKAAVEAGILVGNTPDVLSEATADTAFLLMQCVARKAFFNYKRILDSEWGYEELIDFLGMDLQGRTVGIYGLGRIGYYMAEKCKKAFGMKVIYHNRSRNEKAEAELDAQYVSFEELAAQSDVLSVHAGLTEETKGIFNKDIFAKMKPTSILVNTARGKVVNEKDLIEALQQKQIWGAGLDVTDPEPMEANNPLLNMENVAVLPHIGSATINTRNAMGQLAAENMLNGLTGKKMPACLTPELEK